MRVIIAGGRDFNDYVAVENAIRCSGFEITEVVSGGARGADQLGERYAMARGINLVRFPADWERHGKRAGPLRNNQMAEYADALIAMPGSTGTRHMIAAARRRGLRVWVA